MAQQQSFSSTPLGEKVHVDSTWRDGSIAFVLAFVFLFLTTTRYIYVHDEGLTLTAALRVSHGQVPYRDFYFLYGPALPYSLAALFKIFGPTVLVARIFDLAIKALLCASFFVVLRRACRLSIALGFSIVLLLWIFMLQIDLWAVTPASLFSFWALVCLLPVFTCEASLRRFAATGVLIGLTELFRHDCGIAVLLSVICPLAAVPALRPSFTPARSRQLLLGCLVLLGCVALVVIPPLIAYLAVAPSHDIWYQLVEYPARYYRAGRGVPFDRNELGRVGEFYFLLPGFSVLLAGLACVALWPSRSSTQSSSNNAIESGKLGLLMSFGIFTAMMSVKSLVRIVFSSNYQALVPALLILAVLLEVALQSSLWSKVWLKAPIYLAVALCLFCTVRFGVNRTRDDLDTKGLVLPYLLHPQTQAPLPPDSNWCHTHNSATSGLCFLVNTDHIHAIEFLQGRICPGQTLYVGLRHHDRIFINDNATYFILNRLPATKWSQMDPFVQNTVEVQREMISDLKANKPPYIVLDSEFEAFHEPNASSVSTGVHLLDDFIRQQYTPIKQFGALTILQPASDIGNPSLSSSGGTCNVQQ